MMKNLLSLVVLVLLMAGCQNDSEESLDKQTVNDITKESLMGPIEAMASDEFEGRGTGSSGQEKTVEYLVAQMKEYGLQGGMDDGSYVQDVPLTGQTTTVEAPLQITKNGKTVHSFNYTNDFMAWPANMSEEVSVDGVDLVYVGYGIQAPEENWDDFKEADVKGKVIVVKNNDPSASGDLFGGNTRLYYGRYDYKYEKARELGAAGVLIIHTTPSAGYGWNVVSNSWSSEQFYLRGNDAAENGATKFNGWLTKEASSKVFESAGMKLEQQLDAAESKDFKPVPLNGLKMNLSLAADYRSIDAKNVLGVVKGSNEELNDEYLVYTAHYDHLGITSPVKGDSINNGALDNAAGVSAVLNIAKELKDMQAQIDRSALFLLVGAEEKGLLGSKYWANNPTVPPGKVTANINLDGMNVYGATNDLVLIGYGRNSVSDVIENLAEEQGRTVKPDPHPDRGYFYRSDHFPLAKKGIPAIFPNSGTEFVDKPGGYSATIDSLQDANYHTVNDEINEYWDLSGMVQDTRLFFKAGYRILNDDSLQTWDEGDEFRQARQQSLKN
jgi:Zn-dependent M28 family amino/carboxypeptidase